LGFRNGSEIGDKTRWRRGVWAKGILFGKDGGGRSVMGKELHHLFTKLKLKRSGSKNGVTGMERERWGCLWDWDNFERLLVFFSCIRDISSNFGV
jgi:hypothetical protein